ncbi:unnamed protein product [Polarella glacialis]|uniref:Uncharacterized protein n=1 Tax=Polarella glacialis TaxID=89957 RepID=A0A813I5I2_POLGL|nr:unnamed protein product [Polarella glacialis]
MASPGSSGEDAHLLGSGDEKASTEERGIAGLRMLSGLFLCALCLSSVCFDWIALDAGPDLDDYRFLGPGACIDEHGRSYFKHAENAKWRAAPLADDGRSSYCAARCSARESCRGFMTSGHDKGWCLIMSSEKFYPSASEGMNGTDGVKCFWRHQFKYRTSGLLPQLAAPIPKIVWTFWENLPFPPPPPLPAGNSSEALSPSRQQSAQLPPFLDLCIASWRALNPNWEVRVLNPSTMYTWISKEDLPKTFDQLIVHHQSDAIRLALLAKYGGVWLDADTILLKPLDEVLGPDPSERLFFTSVSTPHWNETAALSRVRYDNRFDQPKFQIENWFLASPAHDPFILRTMECVRSAYQQNAEGKFRQTGVFSPEELQEFMSLGLDRGPAGYFLSSACMAKVLDEDASLYSWWLSNKVQKQEYFNKLFSMNAENLSTWLFNKTDSDFDKKYLSHIPTGVWKFIGRRHESIMGQRSPRELWCEQSTFHLILASLGMHRADLCTTLDAPNIE